MNFIYKDFEALLPEEVHDLFKLRQEVFILEQNCLYGDIDGADPEANHLLLYKKDVLAAYLRILPPGHKFKEASMGRIVVAPEFRGTGTGALLIEKGIKLCDRQPVRIEAQAALEKYYEQYGFKGEGEVYVVDGIDHLQMVLKP